MKFKNIFHCFHFRWFKPTEMKAMKSNEGNKKRGITCCNKSSYIIYPAARA